MLMGDDQEAVKRAAFHAYKMGAFPLTPLQGKKPVRSKWVDTKFDPDISYEQFSKSNFGVVLSHADLIIDVDPRNFLPGDNPLIRLCRDFKISEEDLQTFIVRTGSGGMHIYFKKPHTIRTCGKIAEYKGIDFKTAGGQVVGAGCIHPETGKQYTIYRGKVSDIKPAPMELVNFLATYKPEENSHIPGIATYADDDRVMLENFAKYLETNASRAIEGEQGNTTAYKVACRGRERGFSPEKTLELMYRLWNPRCLPPWSHDELETIVRNAYEYDFQPAGIKNPAHQFNDVIDADIDCSDIGIGMVYAHDTISDAEAATQEADLNDKVAKWKAGINWDIGKDGLPLKNLHNTVNYLTHPKYNISWAIRFNEMGQAMEVWGPLPWDKEFKTSRGWGDTDSIQLKYFLTSIFKYEMQVKIINEAVLVIAKKQAYHPIKAWLNGLKWDGVNRLDMWLQKICGADDNSYVRAVGRKALVGAIARVMVPGCKMDYMLVLEGEQGIGKSTVVNILGGAWYADIAVDPHSKDTVQAMQGRWILEASEMECTTKMADVKALKAFLSRQVDRIRLPYAEFTADIPRQSVFIGTVNPDATNSYLKDKTGNRRFWPVIVRYVKFKAMAEVREQLFAEAVVLYNKGELPYLDDKDSIAISKKMQMSREEEDPWENLIGEWLENNTELVDITPTEIWVGAFAESPSKLGRMESTRIAESMRSLGWQRTVVERRCRLVRGFARVKKDDVDTADIFGENT